MQETETTTAVDVQAPEPNAALRNLDLMIGTWDLQGREDESGGAIRGRLAFEWMEGGFYLVQRVDIDYAGRRVRGTEYVGYQQSTGKLRSYFFSNEGPGPFGDVAIEYVWEADENRLTIWGGDVGSPAHFKGEISPDRRTITGRWSWPGGGYEATMARVEEAS
jgi:hypothetical protein